MSGCGSGSCGCGSDCSCGSCGCGMYPDIEKSSTLTIIEGVAPVKMMYTEGSENSSGAEGGHACKCGPSCSCNPCTC